MKMNLGLSTFVYFLCKILGYTGKQIGQYNDKCSLYNTSSMTFCCDISGLGDIEGNVSTKLNFSVFFKNLLSNSGPVCSETFNLVKQRIETNLCKI